MKSFAFFSLFLALSAPAKEASNPRGLGLASICGQFEAASKTLTTPAGERIALTGSALPAEPRALCAQGEALLRKGDGWELEAKRIRPSPDGLKYPVLLCGELHGSEPVTYWNDSLLRLEGELPKAKELAKSREWCLDGKQLPRKDEHGWIFHSSKFRRFNQGFRSGFSVGNQ